ncbi:DNA-binding transcriptional LysR family regulator [Sphingomonas sp. UYAg733]
MEGGHLRRAAVFHAVAANGGIAGAARAIGKSAPAIHSDLRRFERDVGVPLTERVGRGLQLTLEGRALFETVGRALDDIARMSAHLRDTDPSVLPLRIGAVTGFGRYRLAPRLFEELLSERPVGLRMGSHEDVVAQLVRGEIELALTYRTVNVVQVESALIAEEELVLVGGAALADASLEVIERLRFVTYEEHEYVFARWFAAVHGRQPETMIRHDHCDELEEALLSVVAGRGVTIAPSDAALAFGLTPVGRACSNRIYLCATGDRLDGPDAMMIREMLATRPSIRLG